MGTWDELHTKIRTRMLFPLDQHPSEDTLWQLAGQEMDELNTALNLTDNSWNIDRFPITVQAQQDDVELPAQHQDNFGMAHFVRTIDPTNPNHWSRPVRIVNEPDLYARYGGGKLASGGKHTAIAVSFWMDSSKGKMHMRTGPIPRESCQYEVIYEPAQVRPNQGDQSAFRLPAFDGYLADRIALRGLPHAEYADFAGFDIEKREPLNRARRQEARDAILTFLPEKNQLFRVASRSDRQGLGFRTRAHGQNRWGRGR